MTDREKLRQAIAHLEGQRAILGDEAVEAASAVLLQQLADLDEAQRGYSQGAGLGLKSRLVGRNAELGVLRRLIARLIEGQGRFVSIMGEAGIGKSRLVSELRNHACGPDASSPIQWLEGSAVSSAGVVSYWLFRQIILQYAEIGEQDGEDETWYKLQARLAALFGERSPEGLPYLATMMALRVREEYVEQVKYLDGEAMRRQIFLAARRLFQGIAETRPLVLVLEDLQWIDESSALLLQHLIPLTYRVPVLMLGAARPTVETLHSRLRDLMTTVYLDRYDEIRVPALTSPESARLVANLLDDESPARLVADKVADRAGGNPFFIEETIQSLIREGLIFRDLSSNEWRLAASIETIKVPPAVQDLILARLEVLNERLKEVVRKAAVLGRRFLYRVLLVVARPATEIDEHLEALEQLGLVVRDTGASELAYMFRHDLIHEVAYESIDRVERKGLHALVGAAIERSFPDRLEEFYGLLAYHYSRAEDWEKAQDYLFKAGDHAGFIAADAEALACYAQAEHAYAQAFGDRWNPMLRASLDRKMGEALYRRGEYERALEYLHKSLSFLNRATPKSPLGIRLRIVRELTEQLWKRIGPYHAPANQGATSDVDETVRVHGTICWIHSSTDLKRFLLHTVTMLNLSEREGFPYGMATGYVAAGIACDFLSQFWLAERYLDLAWHAAQRSEHPLAIAYSYMGLALHAGTIANWSGTLELSSKAAELFRRVGDLNGWSYMSHLKWSALAYRGDYAPAWASSTLVCETMDDVGDPEATGRAKWEKGYVLIRLGRYQEAAETLNQAETLGRTVKNPITRVISLHELALLDLLQDRLEEALTKAQNLEKMLLEYRTTQYLSVPSHNVATQAYLQKAEQSSRTDKEYWLRKAGVACSRGLRQTKACYLVRPEAWRLNGIYQWLSGKPKAARKCWQKALDIAEQTGQRYDRALILREMGNRLHDKQSLEKADQICTQLRADLG